MKLIYVCSAYEGAESEYKSAVNYGRYVKKSGAVPIIPHIMYHGVFDDKVYEEKQAFMYAATLFMKNCSEVWVFGKRRTFKMKEEIALATKLGIEIKYISTIKTGLIDDDLAQIGRDYESTTGYLVNGAIISDVVFYLECGISKEVISYAITLQARKHADWRYARAILERCREENVKTMDDFKRKANKNSDKKASYNLEAFENMLNND